MNLGYFDDDNKEYVITTSTGKGVRYDGFYERYCRKMQRVSCDSKQGT